MGANFFTFAIIAMPRRRSRLYDGEPNEVNEARWRPSPARRRCRRCRGYARIDAPCHASFNIVAQYSHFSDGSMRALPRHDAAAAALPPSHHAMRARRIWPMGAGHGDERRPRAQLLLLPPAKIPGMKWRRRVTARMDDATMTRSPGVTRLSPFTGAVESAAHVRRPPPLVARRRASYAGRAAISLADDEKYDDAQACQ